MHQTWDKLLFLHWAVDAHELRPLVPPELELDTFGGESWVSVTPLTIRGLRPHYLPAIPYLSETHELNVRTYVLMNGRPGIWFLSLDASNLLAVLGARATFALPYFYARMSLYSDAETHRLRSRRHSPRSNPAHFDATWMLGRRLPLAEPGSLLFFLVERYCLFARFGKWLLESRIHHRPWPLQEASLLSYNSSMLECHGLATPATPPLLHAAAEPLAVEVWRPICQCKTTGSPPSNDNSARHKVEATA